MMSDQAQPPVPDDDEPPVNAGGSSDWASQPVNEPSIEPDIEPDLGSADIDADQFQIPSDVYDYGADYPDPNAPPRRPPAPLHNPAEPLVRTRRRAVRPPPDAYVPPAGRGYACADVITALFLLLTVLVVSATILLIANPHSALNPLPPATYPAQMVIASPYPTDTPTATPTTEPFTATPASTATLLPSATTTPTDTPTVTPTPVVGLASGGSSTQAPGSTPATPIPPTAPLFTQSPFAFTAKAIRYQANATDQGCQWQSIAGSVTDLSGKPVKGLAIHIFGSNGNIDEVHYTGTEERFGDSGFEVFLGATPREDTYTIQLLGRTGAPISDTVSVQTHQGCTQNVAVVNFIQNHPY